MCMCLCLAGMALMCACSCESWPSLGAIFDGGKMTLLACLLVFYHAMLR